jgi:hypothetical protein
VLGAGGGVVTETTAQYVRRYYRVPAKRGMPVTVDGHPGRITGFRDALLLVRFTDGPHAHDRRPAPCHPTWRVTYPPEAVLRP